MSAQAGQWPDRLFEAIKHVRSEQSGQPTVTDLRDIAKFLQ